MKHSPLIPVVVVATMVVAGCASTGKEIQQADIQKIVPGTTTKDEMLTMFGPPLSQSFGTEGKMTMLWHYNYYNSFSGFMGSLRVQTLTVLFDQQDKVERFNVMDNNDAGPRLGR